MMEFKNFRDTVNRQFNSMAGHELYSVDIDKDLMWETYINNFPAGTNPTFRERTQHDCSSCKQFIRAMGNVVSIVNGKMVSIWDVSGVGDTYQPVADALSCIVKSNKISNVFRSETSKVGIKENFEQMESGSVHEWNHFYAVVPSRFVISGREIGNAMNEFKVSYEMFNRACAELTPHALETVIDLVGDNNLYRGEENLDRINGFKDAQRGWVESNLGDEREFYLWEKSQSLPMAVTRIRNSAIGTLLVDLSGGMDLEEAVSSYENKVSAGSYKRSTKLITPQMINNAKSKVDELGLTSALSRRYATITDLTVNNVLFADRQAKANMNGNPFDALQAVAVDAPKSFNNIKEVSIDDFIDGILPGSETMELLLENRHVNNLMSLIAPVDQSAKNMLKWDNNFTWCYNGEVTDSIKERVKRAGGCVTGDVRCSLSWFNFDDLDIHIVEPGGTEIYYSNSNSRRTGGSLDVDMNAGGRKSREPVENITYPSKDRMAHGKYSLKVHNYQKRETCDDGFEIEVEIDNVVHSMSYQRPVKNNEMVHVADIHLSQDGKFKVEAKIPSRSASKEAWGINTQKFHRVSMAMLSPNHWDGQKCGNKHYMFMLEDCKNPEDARGFFNEFLHSDLHEHRKVLEVLGANMKAPYTDDQVSGIGFSSTIRNSVICKVTGETNRTIKITF